ncbi:DoxX family protein [Nocardioides sp. URHA0020]|uniref:DoxX family protein n=1 Tax=Nocardioides sp. URHA0020 TaxID=1380392 RepID=UPI00048D7F07|nr:DoxX family protein [Nocardioides sp. URHA0020]
MALPRSVKFLAVGFAVSGTVHLAKPEVYLPLMPSWVPAHREVILASGVAEIACAAGLAVPTTRRAAGWASVLLLLGVYPGNIKMALDSTKTRSTGFKAVSFARLPLQLPMIRAALRAARG